MHIPALACCIRGLVVWGRPPKNRYEHIHVRLTVAIHGHRHFWEGDPTPPIQSSKIYSRDICWVSARYL